MFDITSSQLVRRESGNVLHRVGAVCVKDDAKQTEGLANGSKCLEMDTGTEYRLVGDEGSWLPQPASGGGGGGGSCVLALDDWSATGV